jgi:hypothetical protein
LYDSQDLNRITTLITPQNEMANVKVAIYKRVSTNLEIQESSLIAQEELFIKYSVDRG